MQAKPDIWVPLDERNDYKAVHYLPSLNWTDDDKETIRQIVHKFYNSYDVEGEERVNTSLGSLIIQHKIHPSAERRKLIYGLLESTSSENLDTSDNAQPRMISDRSFVASQEHKVLDLLREFSPPSISSNKDAVEYLEKLIEEAKLIEVSSESLHAEVFAALLNSIESSSKKCTTTESCQQRLSLLVKLIKTFLPN